MKDWPSYKYFGQICARFLGHDPKTIIASQLLCIIMCVCHVCNKLLTYLLTYLLSFTTKLQLFSRNLGNKEAHATETGPRRLSPGEVK